MTNNHAEKLNELVEAAKALGAHRVLRESSQETIDYWENRVVELSASFDCSDDRSDAAIFRKALSNKDWTGPASHFKPNEEVIQTRVLRDLLKGSLRKGDIIGDLVLVPIEHADLALYPDDAETRNTMLRRLYQSVCRELISNEKLQIKHLGDSGGVGRDGMPYSPYLISEWDYLRGRRNWIGYTAGNMREYRARITDDMVERACVAMADAWNQKWPDDFGDGELPLARNAMRLALMASRDAP